ncbi:MAG: HNH endonuclease [Pseudomonadota bacterium]|nr:HNH endonuclease [Pseudomonadota bacterium]
MSDDYHRWWKRDLKKLMEGISKKTIKQTAKPEDQDPIRKWWRRDLDKILKDAELGIKKRSGRRGHISRKVLQEVWERDKGRCQYCGKTALLEFDHIIPVSEGGADSAKNLQILCQKCNRKKYNTI